MVKRREDLTTPRAKRQIGVRYDADAFGQFSESIARFLGTARFLVWQTGIIVIWIAYNVVAPERWQFDPWDRGLVLLTLVLSLQASYAAPLILLAQNRQERRDQGQAELDRNVAERTQADTEFLAREIAGVRILLSDIVTGDELREQLSELTSAVARLSERLDGVVGADQATDGFADPSAGADAVTDRADDAAATSSISSTVSRE